MKHTTASSHGARVRAAPAPRTPAGSSARSDRAHPATPAATCSRRSPCRSTKAFCAPMATISPRPRASPEAAASSAGEVNTRPTLGSRPARRPAHHFHRGLALLFMELDPAQLRALDATVRGGTLEAAARALHLTPSAISQRLRALEVATGRILLVRSKPVRVTASGQAVLRLARQVALLTADPARELGAAPSPQPVPTLPIAVNADSMATWVLPALTPLADQVCFD